MNRHLLLCWPGKEEKYITAVINDQFNPMFFATKAKRSPGCPVSLCTSVSVNQTEQSLCHNCLSDPNIQLRSRNRSKRILNKVIWKESQEGEESVSRISFKRGCPNWGLFYSKFAQIGDWPRISSKKGCPNFFWPIKRKTGFTPNWGLAQSTCSFK